MNLQIGTILIAKDYHYTEKGIKTIAKNKEYPIVSIDDYNKDIIYYDYVNNLGMKESVTKAYIEDNFTIKRYTLQDLKDKKIAVKLRNYEEYKKLCLAVGDYKINEFYFIGDNYYYGVNKPDCFIQLNEHELEGRALLESIDEIDLEVKEEVCYDIPNKNYDSTTDTLIIKLESEINRLKRELDRLEKENIALSLKDIPMPCEQPTPDQAKRERMAWELFLRDDELSIDGVFNTVDLFLAKSKEVKDEE